MPGGVDSYDETILGAIQYVDSEAPLEDKFIDWMLDQGEMESESSASRRLNFLIQADILRKNVKQIQVGPSGYELLEAENSQQSLYKILDEQFIAISSLLNVVGDHHTKSEIHDEIVAEVDREVDWTETDQIVHRLNYFRSMGLVTLTEDDRYELTPRGQDLLSADRFTDERIYSPPPDPGELISRIRQQKIHTPTFYWVTSQNPNESQPDYIRPPMETTNQVSPRDISADDIIFHYANGFLLGFSSLREPGSKATVDGTERFRAPIYFRGFETPIELSTVIGTLTSSETVPSSELDSENYPFTPTGYDSLPFGTIPPEAAKYILNTGGQFEDYGDLTLEVDIDPDNIPDIDGIPLHFPESDFDALIEEITEALLNGQHLILIGPPGTGKTKLAETIAKKLTGSDGYALVTATADWSTFDTVGGYQPDQESHLEFIPGVFLSRFQDNSGSPTNEWLIVDEINRANIDKAFGSFFSALAGDDVTTSFKDKEGNEIEILGSSNQTATVRPNRYYIPDTWRLFATMNTHDKMTLYDMSYAFMRRFAFIHVKAPDEADISADLLHSYISEWPRLTTKTGDTGDTSDTAEFDPTQDETEDPNQDVVETLDEEAIEGLAEFWKTIQPHRTLGPAIMRNLGLAVARHSGTDLDLTGPVKMYVLPQLEDLPETVQRDAVDALLQTEGLLDAERLRRFASDYFGIEYERFWTE